MAKKSKTQRAKASARRAEKREAAENIVESTGSSSESAEGASKSAGALAKNSAKEPALTKSAEKKPVKKEPGRIATFFNGVRSEMKRVTWPSRTDVARWSGVVVGALVFFGVFVFVLDNIFPQLLVLLDSVGA